MEKHYKVTRKYKSYLGKGLKMKFKAMPQLWKSCHKCGKLFIHKSNYIRHYLHAHVARKNYSCIKCYKQFHRDYNKIQHENHCNITEYHSSELKRKFGKETYEPNKKPKYDDGRKINKENKSNYNIRVTKTAFKNAAIT